MTGGMEVYPLVKRSGAWWLPYGPVADAEALAAVFRSDCNVAFLGPEGGSFAFWVNDEGQEIVRLVGSLGGGGPRAMAEGSAGTGHGGDRTDVENPLGGFGCRGGLQFRLFSFPRGKRIGLQGFGIA
jgi:hypothetical protein